MTSLSDKLRTLAALPPGWHYPSSPAIDASSIRAAGHVLPLLCERHPALPEPFLAPWEGHVEAEFPPLANGWEFSLTFDGSAIKLSAFDSARDFEAAFEVDGGGVAALMFVVRALVEAR